MQTAYQCMEVMQTMVKDGLPSSLSDAGVGILCARTAVLGAYFNVRINAKDIKDRAFADAMLKKAATVYHKTQEIENQVISYINSKI